MYTFLEYKSIEELYNHIINSENMTLDSIFDIKKNISSQNLYNWSDLQTIGEESLFSDQKEIYLVDLSTCRQPMANIKLERTNHAIYLYNSEKRKYLSNEIKQLEKANIAYINTKTISSLELQNYVESYISKSKYNIDKNILSKILKSEKNLNEIVNIIDLASIINIDKYLEATKSNEKLLLFQQNFIPKNFRSIKTWYENTTKDEIQLAISLIHTKLKKQPQYHYIIKDLINFDQFAKTNPTVKPEIWYKYFLFTVLNK
jgi:hypothetical protein